MDSALLQAALDSLESRYRDLRDHSEQRLQALQESLDQQRLVNGHLQQELEEARRLQAAGPWGELHRLRREVEVLRAECERRYPALQLSEERGRALVELQRQLDRCRQEQEARPEPPPSAAMAQLEQQLREARDEVVLRRLQLQQVQQELEHYFLLAEGRPLPTEVLPQEAYAVPPASLPLQDADAINGNRLRLMAAL